MGKNQSKLYGSPLLGRAHINPLYELQDLIARKAHHTTKELSLCVKQNDLSQSYQPNYVVLPSDSDVKVPSDTEELVQEERLTIECESEDGGKEKEAELEEFECNVDVTGNEVSDNQEFCFTLYDLDGRGNVTKEDVSGLVRTIYEAVGSSIRMSPSGSRTIRVKLTVSPEKKDNKEIEQLNNSVCSTPRHSKVNKNLLKDDVKNIALCNKDKLKEKDINIRMKDIHELNNLSEKSPRRFGSGRQKIHGSPEAWRDSPRHRRKNRDRSGSLQRQELLEIIQANMEKNNLNYSQPRRYPECHYRSNSDDHKQRHRHRHRHSHGREDHRHYHNGECVDRRHYYMDLAGVENYNSKFNNDSEDNPCPYKCMDVSHKCSRTKHQNHDFKKSGHNRSRSHDLSNDVSHLFRYHLLEKENADSTTPATENVNQTQLKSFDTCDRVQSPKNHHIRNKGSPHHSSKHRNREREHARAMAQVMTWLENRQHAADDDQYNRRHVHEHVHHHYHHYTESPIIL